MTKIMAGPENASFNSILVIKVHLVLNWLIKLRPKFTNFWLLTSFATLQKIESLTLLLVQKFPKGQPVLTLVEK
jgi:hypothetical protein